MIPTNWKWRFGVLLFICCTSIFIVGIVGADDGYSLRADNAVDTPEQNVTFQGNELTIDHLGVFEPDTTISAAVSGPSDSHTVELRSATDLGDIIAVDRDLDDGTTSFDVEKNRLEPGSYVLLLEDSVFYRVVPIVVSVYDLNTDLTADTDTNELTISTTASPTASSGQPNAVEAVVWNEDTRKRVTLSQQSGGEYQTTTSVSEFSDNSYEVYVTALGDETVYNSDDEHEILAVDTANSEESTESDDGDDDSSSSGGDDGNDTTDENTDEKDNSGDTGSTDETDEQGSNDDTTESDRDNDSTAADRNDTSGDDDSESVIQPNNETQNESIDNTQTEDDTPLSPVVVFLALLSSALIAVRQK